jgi:hypothetical protein
MVFFWQDVKTVLRRVLRLTSEWWLLNQGETDGDEEMVIFSDGADRRAIEDRKCMKLVKMAPARNLGMEVMMWA